MNAIGTGAVLSISVLAILCPSALAQETSSPNKVLVSCQFKYRSLTQNAVGDFVDGDVASLECNGKPIELVNGKIDHNHLETKKFGTVTINASGMLVSPELAKEIDAP